MYRTDCDGLTSRPRLWCATSEFRQDSKISSDRQEVRIESVLGDLRVFCIMAQLRRSQKDERHRIMLALKVLS